MHESYRTFTVFVCVDELQYRSSAFVIDAPTAGEAKLEAFKRDKARPYLSHGEVVSFDTTEMVGHFHLFDASAAGISCCDCSMTFDDFCRFHPEYVRPAP